MHPQTYTCTETSQDASDFFLWLIVLGYCGHLVVFEIWEIWSWTGGALVPHFRNINVSKVLSIKCYSQAAGSGSPRAREWGQIRNLSVSEVLSIIFPAALRAATKRRYCYFLPGGAPRHRRNTILWHCHLVDLVQVAFCFWSIKY